MFKKEVSSTTPDQTLIDNLADTKYASYLYGFSQTTSDEWQTAFTFFRTTSLPELRKALLDMAETFKNTDCKNVVIKMWFTDVHKHIRTSLNPKNFTNVHPIPMETSDEFYNIYCEENSDRKNNLEVELKNIRGVYEILTQVSSYLVGRSGSKKKNATEAHDNISKLLKSDALDQEVFKKIAVILTVWEKSDQALKDSYYIPEITNATQRTIKVCREILEHYSPGCTKQDPDNNNTPTMLYAYKTETESVEQRLFSLLGKQDFLGFSQLIQKNLKSYDVNAKDKNQKTLLHHAAINSDPEFLKLLLQEGSDPNIRDENGWTPVHCAAYAGKADHILLLINNKNTPIDWEKQKTNEGYTCHDIATLGQTDGDCPTGKHDDVIEALLQHMSVRSTNTNTENIN